MRIILGSAAFILTFGFSVSLIGLLFGFPAPSQPTYLKLNENTRVAKNIERFLRRDVHVNGNFRHRQIRRIPGYRVMPEIELMRHENYGSAYARYVYRSSKMNDAGLPRDFQYAWRNHMSAWRKQSDFINTLNDGEYLSEGVIRSTTSANSREINRSWDQVLRIAQRYGVRIDESYYE